MSRYLISLFSSKLQPEDANKTQEEIDKIQTEINNLNTTLEKIKHNFDSTKDNNVNGIMKRIEILKKN
jgi:phage-related minor tail protein